MLPNIKKLKVYSKSKIIHAMKVIDSNSQGTCFVVNDKNFLIYGINAGIFYTNINDCLDKKDSISKEISKLFTDADTYLNEKDIHPADKTKKSYVVTDAFFLKEGSFSVKCFDWSDEITKNYGWSDNLRVGIKLKEYNDWLGL